MSTVQTGVHADAVKPSAVAPTSLRLWTLRAIDLRAPFISALGGVAVLATSLVAVPAVATALWTRSWDWSIEAMSTVADDGIATLTALLTVMIPIALIRLGRGGSERTPEAAVPRSDRIGSLVVASCGAVALAIGLVAIIDFGLSDPGHLGSMWNVTVVAAVTVSMSIWMLNSVTASLPERRRHLDTLVAGTTQALRRTESRIGSRARLAWLVPVLVVLWFLVSMGAWELPGWLGAVFAFCLSVWSLVMPATAVWMLQCARSDSFGRWVPFVYFGLIGIALDVVFVRTAWLSSWTSGVALLLGFALAIVPFMVSRTELSLRTLMVADAAQMWQRHIEVLEGARRELDLEQHV